MKFIIDDSFKELGINSVVVAKVYNVEPNKKLSNEFLQKQKEQEDKILSLDYETIKDNEIIEGYRKLITDVGRSVKKNPPTVEAFIENIKHRGSIPKINSVVDIYNLESLNSYLSIGGHDLDSITGDVVFTKSKKEDTFYPISAPSKHVEPTDFLYKDDNGIIAYLGCRDAENYKIKDTTKNILFMIHGNSKTTEEYRIEALTRICETLKKEMPNVEYVIEVIK